MDFENIQERFKAVQDFSENTQDVVVHLLGSMREHSKRKVPFKEWYSEHVLAHEALNIYLNELRKPDITYEELEFVYSKVA